MLWYCPADYLLFTIRWSDSTQLPMASDWRAVELHVTTGETTLDNPQWGRIKRTVRGRGDGSFWSYHRVVRSPQFCHRRLSCRLTQERVLKHLVKRSYICELSRQAHTYGRAGLICIPRRWRRHSTTVSLWSLGPHEYANTEGEGSVNRSQSLEDAHLLTCWCVLNIITD